MKLDFVRVSDVVTVDGWDRMEGRRWWARTRDGEEYVLGYNEYDSYGEEVPVSRTALGCPFFIVDSSYAPAVKHRLSLQCEDLCVVLLPCQRFADHDTF
jgi:hypothetical protein